MIDCVVGVMTNCLTWNFLIGVATFCIAAITLCVAAGFLNIIRQTGDVLESVKQMQIRIARLENNMDAKRQAEADDNDVLSQTKQK